MELQVEKSTSGDNFLSQRTLTLSHLRFSPTVFDVPSPPCLAPHTHLLFQCAEYTHRYTQVHYTNTVSLACTSPPPPLVPVCGVRARRLSHADSLHLRVLGDRRVNIYFGSQTPSKTPKYTPQRRHFGRKTPDDMTPFTCVLGIAASGGSEV